jgi:hypothetical protein
MASGENLTPCPACGKHAGELREDKAARFRAVRGTYEMR